MSADHPPTAEGPGPKSEARGRVSLATFDNSWYDPGRGLFVRAIWFLVNAIVFRSSIVPFVAPKRVLLRRFGANVGRGVVIKPSVNVKYPWNVSIGDHSWIGEDVWIDSLDRVEIGADVCISQGALLLSGNHNFKSRSFGLRVAPIVLEDGVWIGAHAMVTGGVTCRTHAVLAVASVASRDLESYAIHRGNPATRAGDRTIDED